ncbi:hypothetical protein KVR01_000115 [Diaporthe batatas]|uniref:uncharacterized protein n=1 Tax=Diaporthe batatas TaxID=748121 RepID=UPI001D04E741|nr:uncharacterized protein KVR01_000115 [Diaporthe batatas]KAG8169370.1 hypothetical protein KVR01_000115 [Diaporthe batatas]
MFGHPPRATLNVVMKRLGLQHGTAFLMAFLTIQHARGAQLGHRQNPGFITALPTVAATTFSTSPASPSATLEPLPNPPQQPGPIFTPSLSTIDVASSPALIPPAVLPSSTQISSTTPTPTSFRPTTTRTTQAAAASALEIIDDHYFGGIPKPSPDVPISGVFMVLFILGALIHGLMYWRNIKQPIRGGNGDRLSALMICFCLAEALVCGFRLAWASTEMQPVVVFFALVSESVGSVSLFTVNFLLTNRLIRLLDLPGLHEFNRNAGGIAQSGARLLQASNGLLMITGFIFLVVVLAASTTENRTRVEKFTARTTVYFIGAGVLTMTSQATRFASTFAIWQPADQTSMGILSKPVYYITGFGMSVSIIILYAASRIDLLFGKSSTSNGRSSPRPSQGEQRVKPVTLKPTRGSPLRLNPILTPAGDDGRYHNSQDWPDTRSPMTASSTGTFTLEKEEKGYVGFG